MATVRLQQPIHVVVIAHQHGDYNATVFYFDDLLDKDIAFSLDTPEVYAEIAPMFGGDEIFVTKLESFERITFEHPGTMDLPKLIDERVDKLLTNRSLTCLLGWSQFRR